MHGNCCGDGCASFWLGFAVLQTFYDKACDREIQKLTVRCRDMPKVMVVNGSAHCMMNISTTLCVPIVMRSVQTVLVT